MSPLRATSPSMILCTLYSPMSPLRPSVPSMVLCPLFGPLPPLQHSVLSTAFCLLYSYFPLYDPLTHLRPFVLSMALSKQSETTCLVSRNVLPNLVSSKLQGLSRKIYFVVAMIAMIAIITIIPQAKCSAIIAKWRLTL
jgi:hypothetical protein